MKKIVVASNNEHKISEIKQILNGLDFEIKSLKEEDIYIEVEEDGKTFEENAKKKATEIADFLNKRGEKNFVVLADDSGLEVEYLNGAPGIYSARYSGEHGNDEENNKKLLEELREVPKEKRGAKFICAVALMCSDNIYIYVRGEVEGIIMEKLSGNEGFGYDPLFFYKPLNKTFSELTADEKNKISHRGVALKKLKEELVRLKG
ncbi:XTP/dITP diphosphatase [Clostridium sp. SHJSY1]|uniref:XTP/dITP diphosphatase n=1 Tax=Clostridium sp. SHJSY1 TaxID=2942483 RepID=UPI0028760052|nr:XTP/dITP diphosphatase [Clostridium sp. SHJSY1]MDS0528523.1 XTP/dITP diphosphatase [Clostridium sp. SHJSY1]